MQQLQRNAAVSGAAGGNPKVPARATGAEYWRVERVALYLDVSKKRVYQLVQEKRLEAVRLGPRQMRICRRSLEEYLAELRRKSEEEE